MAYIFFAGTTVCSSGTAINFLYLSSSQVKRKWERKSHSSNRKTTENKFRKTLLYRRINIIASLQLIYQYRTLFKGTKNNGKTIAKKTKTNKIVKD